MLRLSTSGRYATRIMVYLAANSNGRPARKHEIAEAEEIAPDYVEQLLVKLKTAGLVASRRGAKGGFSLLRDPQDITVADVLGATEGPLSLVLCRDEGCTRISGCVTRPLWQQATEAIETIFSSTTIGTLAAKAKKIQQTQTLNFQI